jgi:cytochrome P450
VSLFLKYPEQARHVREDPSIAVGALDEILRFEPPVQVIFRAAARDLTLGDVDIPKDSIVLGLTAAATRSRDVVGDPDRFDVRRTGVPSLSFGGGAHYCLGAHLARLSLAPLFPKLLKRFPDMVLAAEPAFRSPGVTLRGFENLPVILQPVRPRTD